MSAADICYTLSVASCCWRQVPLPFAFLFPTLISSAVASLLAGMDGIMGLPLADWTFFPATPVVFLQFPFWDVGDEVAPLAS
ncbi:hypothetical protein C8F01DRAFT_1251098 [Mycena amicta]|nr:hypothetical protein C8F01DRAFT_1251098 [Mycena amicta]